MVNREIAISIGMREHCNKLNENLGNSPYYRLGVLESLVAALIEGSQWEKRNARTRLQIIIGRGRCIINAAEYNSKNTTKPQSSHETAAIGPCIHIEG